MNNYNLTFSILQEFLGVKNVYQSLPGDLETPYPFAVIEESESKFQAVKVDELKEETIIFDLWFSFKERQKLNDVANQIFKKLFELGANKFDSSLKILKDDSTSEILWHGVCEVVFN